MLDPRSLTALLLLASTAAAQGPGSLLVYPQFDHGAGQFTIFSLTNASEDVVGGSIGVRLVFVTEDCQRFTHFEVLTPNDNFSGFTRALAQVNNRRGYFYALAVDEQSEDTPVAFDELIGTSIQLDGLRARSYEFAPFVHRANGSDKSPTDANQNGRVDLDDVEYSSTPQELLFPLFLGQSAAGLPASNLILFDLNGAPGDTTIVDLRVYNDNEEGFVAQHSFSGCWSRVPLTAISGVFQQSFLRTTADDPTEFLGFPFLESGWFRARGVPSGVVDPDGFVREPALLGALVRRGSEWSVLPVGRGRNPEAQLPF